MIIKYGNKEDCIVAGIVVADSKEEEYNGENFVKFGLGIGKDKDGNNVSVWNRKIDLKKSDRVLVCGKLKINQKDDKTFYSISADYISKETCEKNPPAHMALLDEPEMKETEDDSLPF